MQAHFVTNIIVLCIDSFSLHFHCFKLCNGCS